MRVLSVAPGMVVAATFVAEAVAVALDVNTIVLAVIGLIGTTVTGYLALRMAALAQDAKESKQSMKEIHVAVNSSKTVLENKVDDLIKQNVELAKMVATLEEARRGADLAKAVASVPPGLMVTPMVAPVAAMPAPMIIAAPVTQAAPVTHGVQAAPKPTGQPSTETPIDKLDNAITDLHSAAKEAVAATEKTEGLASQFPQQ